MSKNKVLIINYHRIMAGGIPKNSRCDVIYQVDQDEFMAQIELIRSFQIPIVSLSDIVDNNTHHPFSIAFTFDDGNSSDYEFVAPYLKMLGVPATFFIHGNANTNFSAYQKMPDLFEIGSHAVHHHDLTILSSRDLHYELNHSKNLISQSIGRDVRFFSLPFGNYNAGVIKGSLAAGYRAICNTDVRLNCPHTQPHLLHRWSVCNNTSIKTYESMINRNYFFVYTKLKSKMKQASKTVLGNKATHQLNMFLHR